MGAAVKEFDDGLRVEPSELRGAKIETCGDHRIAMAFTVAALLAEVKRKSMMPNVFAFHFPSFLKAWNRL